MYVPGIFPMGGRATERLVRLDAQGRILIPKKFRELLKLLPGSILSIESDSDTVLILRRVRIMKNPRPRRRRKRV